MKIIIDIGTWNSDRIMKDLQQIFSFDSYFVSMKDDSISLSPNAWNEFSQGEQIPDAPDDVPPPKTPAEPTVSTDPMKCVCPVCGKKFKKHSLNQKYCSQHCKRTASYKRELEGQNKKSGKPTTLLSGSDSKELTCPECGKKFKRNSMRQIYCSETCRNQAKKKRLGIFETQYVERKCPICHKTFTPTRPNQIYCSNECKRRKEYQRLSAFRAKKDTERASKKDDTDGRPATVQSLPKTTAPVKVPVTNTQTQKPQVEQVKTEPVKMYNLKCELCEMSFQSPNKDQKFCKPCLESFGEEECAQLVIEEAQKKRAIEEAAKIRWKVCPRCGHTFEAKNPAAEFFCPTCVQRAQNAPLLTPNHQKVTPK